MRFITLIFTFVSMLSSAAMADPCSPAAVAPVLNQLFSSLGHDCDAYASLFSPDAKYYHQHDGFKVGSDLLKNCQSYATFCPGNSCKFLQSGPALTVTRGNTCEVLAPYIWSELPANSRAQNNLEPHTGWEYLVIQRGVPSGIRYFAELESTYSVAFNWAKPDDTPALFQQSTLQLLALGNSASKGECNAPIAPILTSFFAAKSVGGDLWKQQGDATVLAAGGLCQVTVPYSAQVVSELKSGRFVLILQLQSDSTYKMSKAVEFSGFSSAN